MSVQGSPRAAQAPAPSGRTKRTHEQEPTSGDEAAPTAKHARTQGRPQRRVAGAGAGAGAPAASVAGAAPAGAAADPKKICRKCGSTT